MKINTVLLFSLLSLGCHAQENYEDVVARGIEAVQQQRLDEAEQLFGQALEIAPGDYRNALVHMNLGKVRELKGEDLKALDAYTAAIKIYPKATVFLMARAQLYLKLENYHRAILDFTDMIALDGTNAEAYAYRGFANSKQRAFDKAKADFAAALEIAPDNYTAQMGLVVVEQQMGHRAEAMKQINLLLDKFPDKAELYSMRADMETEANQLELALLDLNKAVELEPGSKTYVLNRAYLHKTMKNMHLARLDFMRAIELGVPWALVKDDMK